MDNDGKTTSSPVDQFCADALAWRSSRRGDVNDYLQDDSEWEKLLISDFCADQDTSGVTDRFFALNMAQILAPGLFKAETSNGQ